jgi:telomerase reverse transcriptase
MYIFPRQFRLHNVFTSEVDRAKTSQKFQDYTLREDEISPSFQPGKNGESTLPKIPKRLRGMASHLVERLQVRHERCSYNELLRHYCPSPLQPARRVHSNNTITRASVYPTRGPNPTQVAVPQNRPRGRKYTRKPPQQLSPVLQFDTVAELACPPAHVSAFCQSVLSTIIPNDFWGEGDIMEHNRATLLKKVDRFIKLRRFETMSLHEVTQDLKVRIGTSLILRSDSVLIRHVYRFPISSGSSSHTSKARKLVKQTRPSVWNCFKSSSTMSSILCSYP